MWREQLDAFWDGERSLALGFFDGAERTPAFGARPDLIIAASKDPSFAIEAALVDVIDAARWRCGHCLVQLPPDRLYVSLRSPDGAELRLALLGDKSPAAGGEQRLLLTLLPDAGSAAPASFRVASLSAHGDFDRLAREQIVQSGVRLVWAFGQRRSVERRDGAARLAHLWPARRVFPAFQSRIVLEPIDSPEPAAADGREAPFAIMDHWVREGGAPRVALRLRVPDSLDESASLLNRCSVVLVMNQRRRLREWMREQRDAGEPIIDALSFDDIRQATGEPGEHPDAVEAPPAIVVANLLKLISDPDSVDYDGFAIRRLAESGAPGFGAALDIDFYGAALGDEVGLVGGGADVGDFGAAPSDPGGARYIRLFRVESDGLKPRRVNDDEPLLDEILRLAADRDSAAGGVATRNIAERAASLYGRREKLVASLNGVLSRAEFPGRFDVAGAWDIFEPLCASSFAALVAQGSAADRVLLQRIGGYLAYRADPSVVAALLRRPELVQFAGEPGPMREQPLASERDGATTLLERLAAACGAEGLIPHGAGLPAQIHMFRLLQARRAEWLLTARLSLSASSDERELAATAEALRDEAVVEHAAAHHEAAGRLAEAMALRGYLELRRQGGWLPLDEAAELTPLIASAVADWEAETAATNARKEPAQKRGFLGAVRGFFGLGGAAPEA